MTGYNKLATLLARFPELLVFRKFDRLSVLLLLYQQADLTNLEQRLNDLSTLQGESTDDLDKSWSRMSEAFSVGEALSRKVLLDEIRDKLNDYHQSLFRIHRLQTLQPPASSSCSLVNEWLSTAKGGNNFLEAFEAGPWEPENIDDLVSLINTSSGFDKWLAQHLTPVCHFFGRRKVADTDPELGIGQLWEYKQSKFVLVGNICSVFLSSILPIVSIFLLFFITNPTARIGMVAGFTIIFSCILCFVTRCKRVEMFAATAAFAAVQVVFLQGVDGVLKV